ncbi:MAG: aspartate racemase [Gammaproteobacteria bacterium]|jgi:aspartate racemase
MKTIGLLGGMSWESTVDYYRAINLGVKASLGGLHSAKIVLYSVDFESVEKLQSSGNWDEAARLLTDAAINIQAAGADFMLICTNTMHKVAAQIEAGIDIPLLHIADATAQALELAGIKTVGLLGTAFTMEHDFYKGRLTEQFGVNVLTPNQGDIKIVHDIIYDELCQGKLAANSKVEYLRIVASLSSQGAEAVILGCTEIGMLIKQKDTPVLLFDTTEIHAQRAVDYALS